MSRLPPTRFETMAEILEQLGGIDPGRVRVQPSPGQATERDLTRLLERTDRLYELIDGVLVEKPMGLTESFLAMHLGRLLGNFVAAGGLGILTGADGALRLMPGLVRLPDLSFISWERLPVRGEVPDVGIARLVPDLAVEVLSPSNTPKEMERKLKEYFLAGVRLVWFVSGRTRTVEVFTAPDQSVTLTEEQSVEGGDVLPGLSLPVRSLFEQVSRQPEKKGRSPRAPKKKPRR